MRHTKLIKKVLTISAAATILASSCLAADFTEPTTKMEFVKISGGTFLMGDLLRQSRDASPPHEVTVKDFMLGKYEVTFDQYDAFCESTKRDKPDDNDRGRGDRPVINVSWEDAVAFSKWLSKKSGMNFRLPSEAQWEYAARAGTSSPYWWGHKMEKNLANCFDCGSKWDKKSTAPVGSFKANPWGLHDMSGNVYEWLYDTATENYEVPRITDEPYLDGYPDQRIARGGSYLSGAQDLRSFFRNWFHEKEMMKHTGFRLAIIEE